MAGAYQKRNKEHPEPSGKMVKFYLERTQFMDRNKHYELPVNINGYAKSFAFGKRHEVPAEWVKVIQNARSAYVAKSALREFERTGHARAQDEWGNTGMQYEYVPDYGVIIEKEA